MSEKSFVRVKFITQDSGVSKPLVFQAIKEGKLQAFKLGNVLLISYASYRAWLASAVPWSDR